VSSFLLVPLATARLRLEPIREHHADALYDGIRDPSLYTYETDEPPRTLRALRSRYAHLEPGRSPNEDQHWLNWVPIVRENERAIGFVQATVADDLTYASIGYAIVPEFQRRGYGAEAVGAMSDHLLANGVSVLHAVIDVRNTASIALAERLGFERTATRRSDDVIGGVRGIDHDYVRRAGGARRNAESSPS
jgi:RimJ/RimL family protein N-acetyltransferase